MALPLHLLAAVLVNLGAYRTPSPSGRRSLIALGSLSLLAVAGLFALSNLGFWNGEP